MLAPELLRYVDDYRMMLLGLAIVLMMIFKPSGFWGEKHRTINFYSSQKGDQHMAKLLSLEKVSVKFGGLVALNEIDLSVNSGEIVALIGPNGAGKTTLFNLLTGVYKPTSGTIHYMGQNITKLEPFDRARLGIARTFQNTRLIKNMTVLENVLVAHPDCNSESILGSLFLFGKGRRRRDAIARECIDLLEVVGLHRKLDEWAGNLLRGAETIGNCACHGYRLQGAAA